MEQKENYIEYYPIGSVIVVRGNVKKVVVIARGLMTELDGELQYFDYGAVTYPEGLISDKLIYFNHKDIQKVVFEGYADEDETLMKENINRWVQKVNLKQGDPYELNVSNRMKQYKAEKENRNDSLG